MRFKSTFFRCMTCAAAIASTQAAMAQQIPAPATVSSGYVEAGMLHDTLSSGYPNWQGLFFRGGWRSDPRNFWTTELVHSQEFGDRGTQAVFGNTHTINELWYSNVSVSGSNSGFYLPNFRFDASLSRKWLEQKSLVGTAGITAVDSKDGHKDRSLLLAIAYYFPSPDVLEGGIRFNNSNPGQVRSHSQYVAWTHGENGGQIMSLRYGFGTEAYQYTGDNALLVDFNSETLTATWRVWLRPRQGVQIRAEAYHNPYYDRRGIELSVFQEF